MGWKVKSTRSDETRTLSLGEFFDALEANGLPQIYGTYWSYNNGGNRYIGEFEIGAACALGQAALNLNTSYSNLEEALGEFKNSKGKSLTDSIIDRNDQSRWGVKQIAKYYRTKYANRLKETFEIDINYEVVKD